VNIGQRQAGRVRAESVVDCTADSRAIQNALERVLTPEFKRLAQNIRNPYDRLGTSDRIVDVLRAFDPSEAGPKRFYDLAWSEALAAADPSES
jgi:GDP/UDP-N,N'-diacetylbacillosamine 2-epimerase (hydrolysing)